jgi:hypothetical protein
VVIFSSTWNAQGDGFIKASKLSWNNSGVKTLFKLETDGTMNFKGDKENKYKIVITEPANLAGKVVNIRSDGTLGYGDASDPTRFIIKRYYSIVSGCNCPW